MTYTVCVRVHVLSDNNPFVPEFLATRHKSIKEAAIAAGQLFDSFTTKTPSEKVCIFARLRTEFQRWAQERYILEKDEPLPPYRTLGVSICCDNLEAMINDGIPKTYVRQLNSAEDMKPQYEFLCCVVSGHPLNIKMGYTAQARDRHATLKNLVKKEKMPAPKFNAAA